MNIQWDIFFLQKAGNAAADYEDACWPSSGGRLSTPRFRCAIADGATEASFSDLWAQTLVEAYVTSNLTIQVDSQGPEKHIDLGVLQQLQERWLKEVESKPLSWYAEEKMRDGAFSSLLGLQLCDDSSGRHWSAIAVGDSCLFQVRNNRKFVSFPLERVEQFNSRPMLVSSNPRENARLYEYEFPVSGLWEDSDSFLLMTDSLAQWFLVAMERDSGAWEVVRDLGPMDHSPSFEGLIGELRSSGQLRNDDVTLLRIDVWPDK